MKLTELQHAKRAVINFGRLNPPTIGHVKLARVMAEAAEALDATPLLFLSNSYDGIQSGKSKPPYKNPLPFSSKIKYCKDGIGEYVNIIDSRVMNLYDALAEVYRAGYTECYLFGGDDRADDFDKVKSYNGSEKLRDNQFFDFKILEVINAGKRDENSNNVEEQASASLLRKCVVDLDYERFEQFAGTKTLTEEMFEEVALEMGIEFDWE